AGKTSATIDVLAFDDGLAQPKQTVIVDLTPVAAYDVAPLKPAATVFIADNSPVVSIVKTKDAGETLAPAVKNGLFTVTRVGGLLTAPLVVHYTVDAGSTATAGVDYAALTGTVTFLAGQKAATID
ncbi:MAG: hypothetical protein NT031_11620, partial [Planctomycetota bacterium]|nr:hypothetical protein [Planctomycetota bacterium]